MPIFLSSSWILALLPIAAIGVITLWRGRHNVQPISSTWLWQGLTEAAGTSRARSLDPLWMLLLLAALLAALALARPVWMVHAAATPAPPLPLMSIRGLAGDPHAQLFIRWPSDASTRTALTLEIKSDANTLNIPLTAVALQQGATLTAIPASESISVAVHNGSVVSTCHFQRHDALPFAILRTGAPMPALERIMALQSGAHSDDTTLRPALWLIDDPTFNESTFNPGPQSVVIISPRTPIAGITPEPILPSSSTSPATQAQGLQSLGLIVPDMTPQLAAQSPLLNSVSFQDVHIHHFTPAKISSAWTILATVVDHPWLAMRTDSQTLYIWQASTLSPADTNWPLDPSFVIFFTNVAAHLRQTETASTHTIDWVLQPAPTTQINTADQPRTFPLASILLVLSAILILVVIFTLARRA